MTIDFPGAFRLSTVKRLSTINYTALSSGSFRVLGRYFCTNFYRKSAEKAPGFPFWRSGVVGGADTALVVFLPII